MAINRALKQYQNKSLLEFAYVDKSSKKCIFISHKSEDKEKAIAIGQYILNHSNIDVYLDINDDGLQGAVKNSNDKKIVMHIERALSVSTHLLCLITDKTEKSWWVPYEIGFAKKAYKSLASLRLKGVEDIPSFLKIEKVLMGTNSFNNYLKEISDEEIHCLNENSNLIPYYAANHPLDNYLDWNE